MFIHARLIDGYWKLSMMAKAVDLLDEMIQFGCTPNIVTFLALIISGYRKMGNKDKAHWVFKVMLEQGIPPDPITYVSLGLKLKEKG